MAAGHRVPTLETERSRLGPAGSPHHRQHGHAAQRLDGNRRRSASAIVTQGSKAPAVVSCGPHPAAGPAFRFKLCSGPAGPFSDSAAGRRRPRDPCTGRPIPREIPCTSRRCAAPAPALAGPVCCCVSNELVRRPPCPIPRLPAAPSQVEPPARIMMAPPPVPNGPHRSSPRDTHSRPAPPPGHPGSGGSPAPTVDADPLWRGESTETLC